jgi:hypothetical protein
MSRGDLKELGEYLDEGQAGLVVVGVAEMEDDIKRSMQKADKVETRGRSRPMRLTSNRTPRPPARCSQRRTPKPRTDGHCCLP